MNDANNTPTPYHPEVFTSGSASSAKTRLMEWAEECDARSRKARPGVGTIAATGAIAVLGCFAFARVLSPRGRGAASGGRPTGAGRRLIMGAIALGAKQWLLPYALRAIRRYGSSIASDLRQEKSSSTPLASR